MKLSVSETSKLMGVSVRTLHYYDAFGLLKPSETSDAGYRYYDENSLTVLQQILFYRELELPLKEIFHILSQPDHDQRKALLSHRELLLLKQKHIEAMLRLVDETLGGNKCMKKNEFTFTDIEKTRKQYADEVKTQWRNTNAYQESTRKDKNRTNTETLEMMNETNDIFASFARSMDQSPSALDIQLLVARWQAFITKYHYNCTNEILESLGAMYISDDRFTENIDRFGDGTAQFMNEAIKAYCAQ